MVLNILSKLPEGFFETPVTGLHELLGGPTLIHLKTENPAKPLYLSTLLHGNETSSHSVLLRFLKNNTPLKRDLIIFIGNTLGASKGMRHLPGQVDYNRIWEEGNLPEHGLAKQVIEYAQANEPFASIDLHNNTGKNPFYGCINKLDEEFKNLASHFGEHTVYFTEPHNVQSMAFSKICPSVTVEAGLPGEEAGIEQALKFVETIYHFETIEHHPTRQKNLVYHTLARFKVHHDAKVDFEDSPFTGSDLSFVSNLDSRNFEVVKKGTRIGFAKNLDHLIVENNRGEIITDQFIKIEDNKIIMTRTFIPSMFTKDIYVMKEDCLGYLMEVMIALKQQ
ncbi:MAG: M14 family metallopeptidase [Bdellovibrionota bacterium]|nr:M14 family metallopeptidase [Bdellovibrionota bacterium]